MNGKCPICKLDCALRVQGIDAEVVCPRCGKFRALFYATDLWTRTFAPVPKFLVAKGADPRDTTKVGELLAPYLSIYVREQNEAGGRPVEIDIGSATRLEELAETYAHTPVASKPSKLLRLLEKRTTFPGQQIRLDLELDYPAAHALNAVEAGFYLQALQKDGSLQYENTPEAGQTKFTTFVTITLEGWQRLARSGSGSRTGFVAMSFDPSLDSVFLDGIAPAVRDAGYEPLRVDKVHHNDKICDRIVVEIRRSRFLVADVTNQRQGVYFEAGFAMALGLPVIWCCRKDDFSKVHFDTRQYNHIVWEQPADLRQQLLDRILATIGTFR